MQWFNKKVRIPIWIVIAGGASLVAVTVKRFLVPSVRWFFRSRANEVIHQVNDRLTMELPNFKIARRKEILGRVMYDAKVMEAVDLYCEEENVPREVALERVEKYANEIVPSFNAYIYFQLGFKAANLIAQSFYRVRLGYVDEESIEAINPDDSIVFIMNHRSNMDYILLSLIAAEQTALSYAVGEWAKVFPVQQIIRAMGGFFVRRKSGNLLYRRVLERYIQMATDGGVAQAIFPEGRLTRHGKLQEPRIGLMDYMLRNFDRDGERDIIMIPVAVNYDRVIEDETNIHLEDPTKMSQKEMSGNTLQFFIEGLQLLFKGGRYRYGYAVLNIGKPISIRKYAVQNGIEFNQLPKTDRIEHVKYVTKMMMDSIGEIVPVLPVSIIATILCQHSTETMSRATILQYADQLLEDLQDADAHLYVRRRTGESGLGIGLDALVVREFVDEVAPDQYRMNPDGELYVTYYANSIAHLLP